MDKVLFERLHAEGLISDASLERVDAAEKQRLFSIYWPLRTVLFAGVSLLSAGLAVLLYKNIDSIGHGVILALIAAIFLGCYYYCFRNKNSFSTQRVEAPNGYFDYILLLGCISFASFIAYLQFQYNVFGDRYGLALIVPMVWFFFCAYYFDHLGVLSLAITNLGAWAGVSLTPLQLLKENPFAGGHLIFTGLALGLLLILGGVFSRRRNVKPHFEFTYTNFGVHIIFLAAITGMCVNDHWFIAWLFLVLGIGLYFYVYAQEKKSLYFMVVALLYCYFSLSYSVVELVFRNDTNTELLSYLIFFYFIGSAIAFIRLCMHMNRKIKIQ